MAEVDDVVDGAVHDLQQVVHADEDGEPLENIRIKQQSAIFIKSIQLSPQLIKYSVKLELTKRPPVY